jgi:hypothetical protein
MDWFDEYDRGGDRFFDRSCWATKSHAALQRQEEAIDVFDKFLAGLCQSSFFPITQEIIPATTHLTDSCWKDFRRHVESKGCTAKRRIATVQERGKDKRKGKMYVISVEVPVHPSKAVAVAEEHKKEAEKEAAKRKEKRTALEAKKHAEQEQVEQKRKAEEDARQVQIQQQYQAIIQSALEVSPENDRKPPAVIVSSANMGPPTVLSTSSTRAIAPTSASAGDLLKEADRVYETRRMEIRGIIQQEEMALKAKKRELEREALDAHKRAKTTILNALPCEYKCTLCATPFKIEAAKCVTEDCNSKLCIHCVKTKVEDHYKCVVCRDQKSAAAVQNVKCPLCVAKIKAKGGCFQFDYCREDCGCICPDHTTQHECCVCGYSDYCTSCVMRTCGRCGDNLCSKCQYKEGCMCAERKGRRLWDLDY